MYRKGEHLFILNYTQSMHQNEDFSHCWEIKTIFYLKKILFYFCFQFSTDGHSQMLVKKFIS